MDQCLTFLFLFGLLQFVSAFFCLSLVFVGFTNVLFGVQLPFIGFTQALFAFESQTLDLLRFSSAFHSQNQQNLTQAISLYEFRPGNKTIYVVFDEESEFSGPRTPKLSLDQVCQEKRTPKNLKNMFLTCFFYCLIC